MSLNFGYERGEPVDRYYVEHFLAQWSSDIKGRVLEVGDDAYSKSFGGSNIEYQDILHVKHGQAKATIVGDLTQDGVLPENTFDCIVLTQTLHLIFDLKQAARNLHKALKPGGVLLLTVPGITQTDRDEWRDHWYWAFTAASIKILFAPLFHFTEAELVTYGNVFAATAFLQGVALSEVDPMKLDVHDAAYPVIVGLRAMKS